MAERISPVNTRKFNLFVDSVIDCDAEAMTRHLQDILSVGSYYNLTTELHYEAVVMTILYSIVSQYDVRSECEQGNGRVDIIMKPKHEGTVPIIIELKKTDSEDRLEYESEEAIGQIHDRRYYLDMHGKVILVGIAFWGKMPKTTIETIIRPRSALRHAREFRQAGAYAVPIRTVASTHELIMMEKVVRDLSEVLADLLCLLFRLLADSSQNRSGSGPHQAHRDDDCHDDDEYDQNDEEVVGDR